MISLLHDPTSLQSFEQYLTNDRAQKPGLRNYQESTLKVRRGGESIINP